MASAVPPSSDGTQSSVLPRKPVPLVAIGGSAGALEAVTELLQALPTNLGLAYVYVQHLDPDHESHLSAILNKVTAMPVRQAEHEVHIQPNEVYVIPPNKDMEVVDGVLTLMPRRARPHVHLPIDQFFVSLADRQGAAAIAVVLSGMASDGTVGLKAIKQAGGFTFAQDTTALFQSMPRSAIAEGVVDLVLPPAEIAREIVRLSQSSDLLSPPDEAGTGEAPASADDDLREVLRLVHKTVGVDFSHYKMTTVRRRVSRRLVLHRLDSLTDYAHYLRQHPDELDVLYGDLLINVTRFFRDPETTDYLQKHVLPRLVRAKPVHEPLRIWVPACSTGEEAYSLAMLLMETLGDLATSRPIQIFASDLSETAIHKARLGVYSRAELADVSPKRLQRFFTKVDDQYRVSKSLREVCVFAPHNLFKDPPFSRLDFISCCNLLIYLDATLQKQALTTFHYALNPGGYLQLGKSEMVGTSGALFSQVEKSVKVFARKNDTASTPGFQLSAPVRSERPVSLRQRGFTPKEVPDEVDLDKLVDGVLLSNYVPASVVVNPDLDILQFRGSTGLYLEPSPGRASLNLLKMARPELVLELRTLVHKAQKAPGPVRKTGLQLSLKGQTHHVAIEVAPLKSGTDERLFLVVFEEITPPETGQASPAQARDRRIKQLEAELAAARDDMRSVVEAQEASNEELQSANEEIVSSNEELQSINEELETSKEEIESTNEELITINQELQVRNDQLAEAYEYAEAIFGTIRESTLMLDADLRVRSASRAFYKTFRVTPEETEGRLLYELGDRQWDIPALRHLLEEIIPGNEHFSGYEVQHDFPDIGEKIMLLNARRMTRKASGRELVLLAIEDITEHRRAQRLVEERETWLLTVTDNAPVLIWMAGAGGTVNFLNKTGHEYLGELSAESLSQGWPECLHPNDRAAYASTRAEGIAQHKPYRVEYRLRRRDGAYRWFLEEGKPLTQADGLFSGFLGAAAEVHDQKLQAEELERRVAERTQALRDANADLERSNEELRQYAYVASHDLQEPLRKIVTFSKRLEKTTADDLSSQGKEYLSKITLSAQRMTRLIDELLNFSRTIRQDTKFVSTDLNQIVQDVLVDFDLIVAEKSATVEADSLPTVDAMPLQMTQLFHNLLSNALKFVAPDRSPIIRVSVVRPAAEALARRLPQVNPAKYWEIVVQDNGIGFNPEFSEQIFSIFQRLHDKSAYVGTGIGLALCRRIATNHGGDLFAEAQEGQGAAFHVLLPEKQPLS